MEGFYSRRISDSKAYLSDKAALRTTLLARLIAKLYTRFPMMQQTILKQLLAAIPHSNSSFIVIADFFKFALKLCENSNLV